MLILSARLANAQGTNDESQHLEDQARKLITKSDGPSFLVLPWLVAWERALQMHDAKAEERAADEVAKLCPKGTRSPIMPTSIT